MATGVPQCVSNGSSVGVVELLEERARLQKEEGLGWTPIYCQHYIQTNRAESERQIKEAVAAGTDGVIITVDVPAMGNREADRQIKVTKPGEKAQDAGLAAAQVSLWDPNMKWSDIQWAQNLAPGKPIIVKGISTVADVALAKQHGAAGVFLSNHGVSESLTSPPRGLSSLTYMFFCLYVGPTIRVCASSHRYLASPPPRETRPPSRP